MKALTSETLSATYGKYRIQMLKKQTQQWRLCILTASPSLTWSSFSFKRGTKASHTVHISLYESNTLSKIGCCPFSLSDPMRGEFCVLPSAFPAPASSHVLQLLSAVTQGVALPLPVPLLDCTVHPRLQCSPQELSLKFSLKLVSNRKMLKSCAAIVCTKRQVSRVSFHIFSVGKVRLKLASITVTCKSTCPEACSSISYKL